MNHKRGVTPFFMGEGCGSLREKIEMGSPMAIHCPSRIMFRALPFPPLSSPPGSCTITVRSPMGANLYIEAWLAADVSLMKEALMAVFRCSAEQMRFFLPDGLPHSPLPDRTWIRCLPVIGNTRLVYLVVMDDAPKRVRIRVPIRGMAREVAL
jgi:hypothetical protein